MIQRHDVSVLFPSRPALKSFLSIPVINDILSNGGFLAGGFAHALVTGRPNIRGYLEYGDIDLFFENIDAYEQNLNKIPKNYSPGNDENVIIFPSLFRPIGEIDKKIEVPYDKMPLRQVGNVMTSFGGFANDMPVHLLLDGQVVYTKVQFIKFNHGNQISTLDTFDLLPSRVAFNSKHLWIDDRLIEMWEKKQIVITSTNSPRWLASRLSKYVTRHLYTKGLADESRSIFIKWMMENCSNPAALKHIISLADATSNVILDEDLILLLGKYKLLQNGVNDDEYGDFVFRIMQNRKNERQKTISTDDLGPICNKSVSDTI